MQVVTPDPPPDPLFLRFQNISCWVGAAFLLLHCSRERFGPLVPLRSVSFLDGSRSGFSCVSEGFHDALGRWWASPTLSHRFCVFTVAPPLPLSTSGEIIAVFAGSGGSGICFFGDLHGTPCFSCCPAAPPSPRVIWSLSGILFVDQRGSGLPHVRSGEASSLLSAIPAGPSPSPVTLLLMPWRWKVLSVVAGGIVPAVMRVRSPLPSILPPGF